MRPCSTCMPWTPAGRRRIKLHDIAADAARQLYERLQNWERTWNNRRSDVLTLCAPLARGADIFVTTDKRLLDPQCVERLRTRYPALRILHPTRDLRDLSTAASVNGEPTV